MSELGYSNETWPSLQTEPGNNIDVILWTLGDCLANDKEEFIDLLTESGVSATNLDSDEQLSEKFVANVGQNKELLIGAAYLCAFNTSSVSFSGEKVVKNDQVHEVGKELFNYFEMSDRLEEHSNLDSKSILDSLGSAGKDIGGGAAGGGLPGAIIGALKAGADLGGKIVDKKSKDKFAGMEYMAKQQAAKSQMVAAALAARKAQQEAIAKQVTEKAKTKRTIYIVTGIAAVVLLSVSTFLIIRAKRKNA